MLNYGWRWLVNIKNLNAEYKKQQGVLTILTDIDHIIWQLVQNVVSDMVSRDEHDEKIAIEIGKMTHGLVDYNDIMREIKRQKAVYKE